LRDEITVNKEGKQAAVATVWKNGLNKEALRHVWSRVIENDAGNINFCMAIHYYYRSPGFRLLQI
jgi:hypothetical protein